MAPISRHEAQRVFGVEFVLPEDHVDPPFRSPSPFRMDAVQATFEVVDKHNAKRAMSVSIEGRTGKYEGDCQLGYGETISQPLLDFLQTLKGRLRPGSGRVFLDLGCGRGQVVLTAAASGLFSECYGIELVDSLVDLANEQRKDWLDATTFWSQLGCPLAKVGFVQGNFFEAPWPRRIDVVYVTTTLFSDETKERLADHLAEKLLPGALIVAIGSEIGDKRPKDFKTLYFRHLKCSWANDYLHVIRRL